MKNMTHKNELRAAKNDPDRLVIKAEQGESDAAALTRASLSPSVSNAFTVQRYSNACGKQELAALVDELEAQAKAVNDGSLKRTEEMLIVQAHTLDAVFNKLAQLAISAEYIPNVDRYLRLALKAQSQCRATLETLAMVKNPTPTTFVKQANIANGHQQINNGAVLETRAVSENQESKILEHRYGERLDTRAAGTTGADDTQLAAVEIGERTKNTRR
jgi:hypothetical protein